MESEAVAPSTLPATVMLPDRRDGTPKNLIVPTALSASHVAFSAVRLEPTWMMLGSAAGLIATLAISHETIATAPLVERTRQMTDDFSKSAVDLGDVAAFTKVSTRAVYTDIFYI